MCGGLKLLPLLAQLWVSGDELSLVEDAGSQFGYLRRFGLDHPVYAMLRRLFKTVATYLTRSELSRVEDAESAILVSLPTLAEKSAAWAERHLPQP